MCMMVSFPDTSFSVCFEAVLDVYIPQMFKLFYALHFLRIMSGCFCNIISHCSLCFCVKKFTAQDNTLTGCVYIYSITDFFFYYNEVLYSKYSSLKLTHNCVRENKAYRVSITFLFLESPCQPSSINRRCDHVVPPNFVKHKEHCFK